MVVRFAKYLLNLFHGSFHLLIMSYFYLLLLVSFVDSIVMPSGLMGRFIDVELFVWK